ncbi:hypothetical protein [Enterocloster clostridioformis]|uniref:hypothetical protein n=1 Tax=Enterocloster clostridioformis TaxID=1531 RepID=UPI003AB64DAE
MRTSEQHQRRKWGLAIPRPRSARQVGSLSTGAAAPLQERRAEYCCPTTGQGNERGASAFFYFGTNCLKVEPKEQAASLWVPPVPVSPPDIGKHAKHRFSFSAVKGGAMAESIQEEEYTYQIENINFIVTPSYKDSGETMFDILLNLMLADLASA